MIAHIRQPKNRQSAAPIILARRMVAETLLPNEPAKPDHATMRKILFFGGLALLAVVAALVYYLLG